MNNQRKISNIEVRAIALAFVYLLMIACQPMASQTSDAAVREIRALNDRWLAAAARRDLEGMMAVYAPDARELLPDMPPLMGRDAIGGFYRAVIDGFPRFAHDFTPEAFTVAGSGDLAVVRGSYRFTPDTLEPQRVQVGKYVSVWRRRAGEWRLFINISNGNAPPEPLGGEGP